MTDQIEMALREWQSKQNMQVMYDDEIYSLAAHLKAAGLVSVGTCKWTVDDDGIWNTECNNAFVFDTDGPEANGCKFCPYCGRALTTQSEGGGE